MLGGLFGKRPRSASSEPTDSTSFDGVSEANASAEEHAASQAPTVGGTLLDKPEDPGRPSMLRLLEELDNNRKTARSSSGSRLTPLQTEAWDNSQSIIGTLDPRLRRDLESIYSNIRVLNHLVWFSSEFRRSSRAVLAQYADMTLVIAKRLDEIVEGPSSVFTAK